MKQVIRFSPLSTIKELLQLYRIKALKRLSQNFLLNLKLTNKIVKAAPRIKDCEVCEVGPGPGGITRSIMLKEPRKIVVIEKDLRFKAILEELASTSVCRFDIIFADIMHYDLAGVFDPSLRKEWEDSPPQMRLLGNLPFNVSTPLIIHWLRDISLKRSAWTHGRVPMTLTFQEEVAKRMVAPILSKSRCRLSVMCQNWCKVTHEFTIPGTAFLPQPEVNVGVVSFEPLVEPIIPLDFALIEKFVATLFNGRQKYSFTTAGKLFPVEMRVELTKRLFARAEVAPEIRPFQISLGEWGRLCAAYKELCDEDPRLYAYNYRGKKSTREEAWKLATEDDEDEEDAETDLGEVGMPAVNSLVAHLDEGKKEHPR